MKVQQCHFCGFTDKSSYATCTIQAMPLVTHLDRRYNAEQFQRIFHYRMRTANLIGVYNH